MSQEVLKLSAGHIFRYEDLIVKAPVDIELEIVPLYEAPYHMLDKWQKQQRTSQMAYTRALNRNRKWKLTTSEHEQD